MCTLADVVVVRAINVGWGFERVQVHGPPCIPRSCSTTMMYSRIPFEIEDNAQISARL